MRTYFVSWSIVLGVVLGAIDGAVAEDATPTVRMIFDTDMGNDVDDALALGVIHALADRGECELLAVTTTKDHPLCAPYIDAVNTFYGRGETPIGVSRQGITPENSRFLPLVETRDNGEFRFPHDLASGADAPEAVQLLRQVLAAQPDQSVTIVQVGFSTNLALLLDSPADEHSELPGPELAKQKVRLLSVMAGAFLPIEGRRHREYNVAKDGNAARKLARDWPTPIVFSGYEIGHAIRYPAVSIERDYDYVEHHPLPESYQLYTPTPHERPCWDLTSVLYAVRPDRGYYDLSPPGVVVVDDESYTEYEAGGHGRHRYLIADETQVARSREALAVLASQPPVRGDAKAKD